MFRGSVLLAAFAACTIAAAQKKPLDHSVYDGWRSISNVAISDDGSWVAYVYRPQEGDALAEIRNVQTGKIISIPRVSNWRFTPDSKHLLATQVAPLAETKNATQAKPPKPAPKNKFIVVNLASEKQTTIDDIGSWTLAAEGSRWVMMVPDAGSPRPTSGRPGRDEDDQESAKPEQEKANASPKKKADHRVGSKHILLDLNDLTQTPIEKVSGYTFSTSGNLLAIAYSEDDGAKDRIELRDLSRGTQTTVVTGLGRYSRLSLSKPETHLAFTTDKDDYAAKNPQQTLYIYSVTRGLEKVATPKNAAGHALSSNGNLAWSESGRRLFFPVGPRPTEPLDLPEDEKVSVDIWNWKDPLLQPMQLLQAATEQNRTYSCVFELATGNMVQLESPKLPSVQVLNKRDSAFAIASDPSPYRSEISWDGTYEDIYVVETASGKATRVMQRVRADVFPSPTGKSVAVMDSVSQKMYLLDPAKKSITDVTARVPVGLFDTEDDHPDLFPTFGPASWTADESAVIVRDKFDFYRLSVDGNASAVNLTNGGASRHRFTRLYSADTENGTFDIERDLFGFQDEFTKQTGIAKFNSGRRTQFLYGPKQYGGLVKAKNASTMLFTQQDAREYPDLMLTNADFESPKKITDANPQIAQYNWHTAELVAWRSGDGQLLQGILIKPEDFDYRKKYPMIAYFYERNSETLFQHRTPAPSASTINIPLFASQGYVIFIPDIPYKIGYPGESAVSAIVSGCNSIIERGYVDPKRVGIQGQSWGGYQVAYLVTETNMFAAAEAGAPVSNMFSAYGGIRYGSGMVRQFQYERGQSRIGGTPWNSTLRYVENSPIFHLDKVQTPLMIMHNDRDGAVPYTQGIELFTGLRRLQKPVWMVVYNNEDHNLVQRKNRKDLSIRLSQFFDHYLKGAPMPEWMSAGVPAKDKGYTMGTSVPASNGG